MKSCPLCNTTYPEGDTCPADGATLITLGTQVDLLIGQVLKEAYRIEERISAGGMGVVYRATQIRLGRNVAIKVLQPRLQSSHEVIKRFFQEARLLSQINHPNIVSIIDFGNTEDGLIYMVMEYLQGTTLHHYVPDHQGLPCREIVHIMEQVCRGVEAAHQYPIVHRDLKPLNIFLAEIAGGGYVAKILDFGISKALEGTPDESMNLTQTGMILGTPGYISPEQIRGIAKPGTSADIYALGGILYFMLSGLRPYHGDTGTAALVKQLSEPPAPIEPARLGEAACANLRPVVAKAMHTEIEARYPSARALMADIRQIAEQEQRTASGSGAAAVLSRNPQALHAPTVDVTVTARGHQSQWQTQATVPLRQPAAPPVPFFAQHKRLMGVLLVVLTVASIGLFAVLQNNRAASSVATGEPIVLGMSAAFSGPAKELGRDMRLGVETYFKTVNEAGGIQGRPLELISLDDGYEPDRALANVEALIEDRNVFAIIGNVGTPTAEVALPYVVRQRVLFFGAFTGADLLRQDPPDRYVFNYRASYAQETAAMMRYFVEVEEIPPSAIAVFAQNDSYGDAGFRGVATMLRHYDADPHDILRVGYERNSLNVNEAVAAILAHPTRLQAIVMIGTYKPSARFIQQLKDAGLDAQFANVSFVGSQALAEEFREIGSTYAEGVIVTQVVPHYAAQATGVLAYQDHLKAYAPSEHPGFVSLEGYVTAQLFVEALRRAETLETESVIDALESIRDLDLGMGAAINLGPSQHQASDKVWGTVLDADANYHTLDMELDIE